MGRCLWCGDDPIYVAYHDNEWGIPEHDDQAEDPRCDGYEEHFLILNN